MDRQRCPALTLRLSLRPHDPQRRPECFTPGRRLAVVHVEDGETLRPLLVLEVPQVSKIRKVVGEVLRQHQNLRTSDKRRMTSHRQHCRDQGFDDSEQQHSICTPHSNSKSNLQPSQSPSSALTPTHMVEENALSTGSNLHNEKS